MQNQKLQNFNLVNCKFSCKKASKQANEQKLKKKILKRNKQTKKIVKKGSNFILSTPVIVKSKLCIIFFFP